MISAFADPEYRPPAYYYTDAISDHAARFVRDHARDHAADPLFLYVAYTAAHWPMHAPAEDVARYKGRYDVGYEPVRRARFEKAAGLGLIDPAQGLTATAVDWGGVADKGREAACMEVYAAMVDRMDQGIGTILDALRQAGRLDNALVLFLQDNGGCAETNGRDVVEGRTDGPRAARPSLPVMSSEAFQEGTTPVQTRDGYPVRQGPGVFPGPADTFVAYGRGWANVSNTPFREYKHWVHEGGISTPLIAHWPAGIGPARRGRLVKSPAHLIDLMATCVDLAGATYPRALDGREVLPAEGVSLRPAFEGKPLSRPRPLFWEHEGNRAVRDGAWKLVAKHGQPWELYDIEADRTERNDLAGKLSGRVAEMAAVWDAWAERVGVRPWPVRRPGAAGGAE
jgi:arylsulfatase